MKQLYSLIVSTIIVPAVCLSQSDSTVIIENDITINQLLKKVDQPYLYGKNGALKLWANAYSQSTSIPSQFSNAFIFPKFINQEMKDNAYAKLKEVNRFGFVFTRGAEILFSPDSAWKAEGKMLHFGYRSSTLVGAQFGGDIVRLLFSGNKQFQGETADISNTEVKTLSFRTFEIGFTKISDKFISNVAIGVVQGNSLNHLKINEGSLFTSSQGDYLDLSWNGSFNRSNSANKLSEDPSLGMSLNLNFAQKLNEKTVLRQEVKDFGFVVWNPSSQSANVDTSFRFTGIQFGYLLDISDSSITIGDTLEQKIIGDDIRQSQMLALPFRAEVEILRTFNHGLIGSFGVHYRYIPGFIPLSEASISKIFGKNRSVRLALAYGGFGGFQTSFSSVVFSNHRHSLRIGTLFQEGLINSSSWSGAGIQLNYVHHL